MKFGLFLKQNMVTEWEEFYIQFEVLKQLLAPIEENYKRIKKSKVKNEVNGGENGGEEGTQEEPLISNILTQDDAKIIQETFCEQLVEELQKVNYFFTENVKYYRKHLEDIEEQLKYINDKPIYKNYFDNLETCLKELYKEETMMKSFIEINKTAKGKIIKKFKKYSKACDYKFDIEIILQEKFEERDCIDSFILVISEEITKVEQLFDSFYLKKLNITASKYLRESLAEKTFTQEQNFYFGFWVGILVVCIILCFVIYIHFGLDIDLDSKFRDIFPIFRAFIMVSIILWLLGLNVYVWNSFKINYKLCFQFDNHYSDLASIFGRAAFFTSVCIFCILWYMLVRTGLQHQYGILTVISDEYIPSIAWIILLIYLLFPLKNWFNSQGRIYMFDILYEGLLSIFAKCDFKHHWIYDQLTSMIGPLRDMEYTLCFYVHYDLPFELRHVECSFNRYVVLLLGVFPHFIRALQCLRVIIDTKKAFPILINAGKYCFAISVIITSFFIYTSYWVKYVWITLALISTIYSSLWDMKYDFGFLEEGASYPLRTKLIYKTSFIYYFVAVANFILRFVWLVTLSPEIMAELIRPELSALVIYFCEVMRRGMWNFIRVEYKYIEICNKFLVTNDTPLPFEKTNNGQFLIRLTNVAGVLNISHKTSTNSRVLEWKLLKGAKKEREDKEKKYANLDYRKDFKDYIQNVNEDTEKRINEVNKVLILEEQRSYLRREHSSNVIAVKRKKTNPIVPQPKRKNTDEVDKNLSSSHGHEVIKLSSH